MTDDATTRRGFLAASGAAALGIGSAGAGPDRAYKTRLHRAMIVGKPD